jgi:TolB-like protein
VAEQMEKELGQGAVPSFRTPTVSARTPRPPSPQSRVSKTPEAPGAAPATPAPEPIPPPVAALAPTLDPEPRASASAFAPTYPAAAAAPAKRPPYALIAAAAFVVVGGSSGAWFATHRISVEPVTPGAGVSAAGTAAAAPRPRTGDIRLTVLPFKNVSGDKDLDPLKDGLAEAVVTDFESRAGFKVIEHGLVGEEIEYIEFTQTKYVDPATKAQLGKIKGAEVVVMGSYQRSGVVLRTNARFVDSETGEILQSIKVEAPEIFALQDKLGEEVQRLAPAVRGQLRPGGGK